MITNIKNYSLFFIRHGKLGLPYKDHSEIPFDILADLASSKLNPPIDKKFTLSLMKQLSRKIPLEKIEQIYSSSSKRCLETAELLGDFINQKFSKTVRIVTMPELIEVHFDLDKIYPNSKYNQFDIATINDAVFKTMISGKNCEQVLAISKRIEKIFSVVDEIQTNEGLLFVTHDFLMRVIEIFIKNHGKIESPITYFDLKNTKRNLYLDGFATNRLLSKFSPS